MPFFDEKQGTLSLAQGHQLFPYMPREAVLKTLQGLGGVLPEALESSGVPFPAVPVAGGRIGLIALMEDDALCAVQLMVAGIGQKTMPTADQQRAFLFAALHCKDPCPDTKRPCHFTTGFGSLILSTDPRTGCALARLMYR